MEFDRVDALLEEAEALEVALDAEGLAFVMRHNIEHDMKALISDPFDVDLLELLSRKAALIPGLPLEVDLWMVQNGYFTIHTNYWKEALDRASGGDEDAERWLGHFRALGEALRMRIE
jgi:hypothetical protein